MTGTCDGRKEDSHKNDERAGDVRDDVSLATITRLVAADPVANPRVARSEVFWTIVTHILREASKNVS